MKHVITSAQACAKPNNKFLRSLESLVEDQEATLTILPMIGKGADEDYETNNFPTRIREHLEYGTPKINNNIAIAQFDVRPYQIDPITGLHRFAQRDRSLIFAGTKQRWQYIAHSNRKIPKALITTGACTQPNYATGQDTSAERRRLGGIARRDHEYGAIIVDVVNNEYYHWRNILAQSNGKFTDLGVEYDGEHRREVRPRAMVCGDWHTGYTHRRVRRGTLRGIDELKPEEIFLHDFFNGHSVATKYRNQALIGQGILEGADKSFLSLEEELELCGRELVEIASRAGNARINIVASNHLEFLDTYLDRGDFVKDPLNARIAFKLATAYADGKNPVEEGIRMCYGELPPNIRFLRVNDDVKIRGYQCASHGHLGPGGGYGSIISKEKDFGKSITGHVHSSQKLRNTYTVGCMLPFDMFYLKGSPVSWTHSHAFIYDTGVQMINIINGRWRT